VNIQAKQRVVGAIVLVSLAVIFLPILLPGKGGITTRLKDSEIPPPPDYRFEPMAPAPEVPAIDSGAVLPLELPEPPDVKSSQAPAAAVSKPSVQTTKPSKSQAIVASDNQVNGWIVQVGSFNSQDNANALRDKLRGQGFTSFVEKVSSDGSQVYRVRVGPELTREAADRLQQKLMKDARLNGLVQQYP